MLGKDHVLAENTWFASKNMAADGSTFSQKYKFPVRSHELNHSVYNEHIDVDATSIC